ncbi:hypothetical protein ASPWEDRAFT_35473 [Aspergillus wentii DTO 134E9]|uniref:Uncharacterized protein n=1 Tax=Aspergillus wentii DTO 134E9 TaxID=1073089 RepID=A0A1L9S404_ASPWE|nr:uncharacterized protein ASPWEDRAFT_35473 [Aspergillus wentii DTO 134E9]OJJ41861.1 hypothetical protein ASPWEDRAFT_35473 [Aspergillus wentii DTO 134E9]
MQENGEPETEGWRGLCTWDETRLPRHDIRDLLGLIALGQLSAASVAANFSGQRPIVLVYLHTSARLFDGLIAAW